MRFGKVFLPVVVFLAMTCSISAYTVLLKNGKRVEGILVDEKGTEILIKDKDGIVLTFRKTTLDLDAMTRLNAKNDQESVDPSDEEECCEVKPELEKRSSSEEKRVFTNEDLKDLPELSIMGPDPAEIVDDDIPDSLSPEAEAYWKEQTRELAIRLYEAEDNYNFMKKQCEDAQAAFAWYMLNGYWGAGAPYDPSYVCDGAEQARTEYEHWKVRLEDFQEQARREGALPGWIDPDRLNP